MLLAEQNIRTRLASAKLPGVPEVLLRLMECCQDEHPDTIRLTQLLLSDPGLAATVMGMANDSAYRQGGASVTSVELALRTIGADMLRTLVVNDAINYISRQPAQSREIDLAGFWRLSLRVALAAREIARVTEYPDREEAYLGGLLHDIGRLGLMVDTLPDHSSDADVVDGAGSVGIKSMKSGSPAALILSHSEAGAFMIERWQLDTMLADSVLYHREPASRLESSHALIRIVHLACQLAMPVPDEENIGKAARGIGLGTATLAEVRESVVSQFAELAASLGIARCEAEADSDFGTGNPAARSIDQSLSDELRNMVLAANAGKVYAHQPNAAALHDAIRRSARILFDFQDVALFLRSRDGASLSGALAGECRQRLAAMTISLSAGGAIALAAAASTPAVIRRDETILGLAEEQLMNALSAECLICLPIATGDGRLLGVLIGAAAFKQIPAFRLRGRFLRVFAGQTAAAMDQEASVRVKLHSQMASLAEEYRAASRRMAHEVNNPLSIIKNYLTLLNDKSRSNKPIQHELTVLHEEIDRVSALVGGMAELTPVASTRPGITEVAKVLRDVVYLFKHTEFAAPSINIIATTNDPQALIEGSADLVKQILVNLMKNAVEALDGTGEIEISDEGQVNRDGRLFLELSVRDDGPGIPAARLANLFVPHASSKGGERRGIGLSIVHGLVAKMHGMIMCRSNHRGTVFQILLPIPVSAALPVPAQMTIPAMDAL